MTAKLTPQQAFEAVKVLWPCTTHISHDEYGVVRHAKNFNGGIKVGIRIDWGDQTQYPPPEKKWRPATKEDACRAIIEGGIECRVRDHDDRDWVNTNLCGYHAGSGFPWLATQNAWKYCEVPE